MRTTIEREVVGAIAEVLPVAAAWKFRVGRLAAERLTAILQAERFLEEATYHERVAIPSEVAERWAERLVEVYLNVEAAIEGAIGLEDDVLGDLVEVLDLVSRHITATFDDIRRNANRVPSAFDISTS